MADLCCQYNIAGIKINDLSSETSDRLVLEEDGVVGLDGRPIRAEIDDQGQSDGGIVHPKLWAARVIVFKGGTNIRSVPQGMNAAYFTALNNLEASVISALEGILNTPSALTWTPTGGSGKSITVTYGNVGGEIQFTGSMMEKKFSFALVAADPAIS